MDKRWRAIARRTVEGLGVQPGELVQIRDHTGRFDVVQEMLLAVEIAGATALPEITTPGYLRRLLRTGDPALLAGWDRHRVPLMGRIDRVLTMQGGPLDFARLPAPAADAWLGAVGRITEAEEARRLPVVVLAVPTADRARALGLSLAALESALLPAVAASAGELQATIASVLAAAAGAAHLTICTGTGHTLDLTLAPGRPWLSDDGVVDVDDRARGSIVSNLPAGSVYTTVLEAATAGTIALPLAGDARDVVFHFAEGRIARIDAASGADALAAWLDSHTGEPRRISHIGVGLNPYLPRSLGWTLVDEHVSGTLFLALGENRYMGGENGSSLNVDFSVPEATILAGDRVIVDGGRLLV